MKAHLLKTCVKNWVKLEKTLWSFDFMALWEICGSQRHRNCF